MNRRHFVLSCLSASVGLGSLTALAQSVATRPKSVAGFNFGSSFDEVWEVLKERPGLALPPEKPAGALEHFDVGGGDFSGKVVLGWGFDFNEGKLSAVTIFFKPEPTPLALYRELKVQLTGKYGAPTGERKPDLSEGDRRARVRGAGGRDTAGLVSYWRFPATLADRNIRSITCEAAGPGGFDTFDENALEIRLKYVDETLRAVKAKATPAPPPKPVATPKRDDF